MKILKYEIKIKLKVLLFWIIGLVLLYISGAMEFSGIADANGESIDVVLNYYPPIVLSLVGITEEIDFSCLEGYTWVLGYYGAVIASFYAIGLGANVVNRELVDKTFEFLFTKPRTRKYILSMKILSGAICLTIFSVINFLSNILIMNPVDKNVDITSLMLISSIGTYIVSLLFYAFSILVNTVMKKRKTSGKITNTFFLFTFVLGGIYDVLDNAEILRVFTPLRYFLYEDARACKINLAFLILPVLLSVVLIVVAYKKFEKRDLTEI